MSRRNRCQFALRPLGRSRSAALLPLLVALAMPAVAQDIDTRLDAAVGDIRQALRADTPAQTAQRAQAALDAFDAVIADPTAGNWQRTRARRDRLVALNLLGRHDDVLAGVAALRAEGGELPGYVLGNEADALAARRRPVEAAERYREAIALAPDDPVWVIGLAYALNDLDRPDEAYAVLAPLAAKPGAEGRQARQLQQMLRAWSGGTDSAAAALAEEAAAAPDDAGLRRQRADLERLRDRPRSALALLDGLGNAGAAISRAQAYDQRGDVDAADREWSRLQAEAADWWPLRRGLEERARDRRAVIESRVRAARGDDLQLASGEVRFETTGWTPLLADRWRAYAAHRRGYADFRGTALEDERLALGARYVGPGWRAQAEVNRAIDRFDDGVGLALSGEARLSDDWAVAADAASRAFDLPLRARGERITGDRYGLAVRYSPLGQGFVRASVASTDFSDGNRRDEWSVGGRWRWPLDWWSGLTLSPTVGGSRSRLTNVPYFSPSRDVSADVALAWDHRFGATLDGRHRQRVEVFAGRYWQEGVDARGIAGLRYEYRYEWLRRGEIFARVGRDRRAYDGVPEFQTFVEFGLTCAIGAP